MKISNLILAFQGSFDCEFEGKPKDLRLKSTYKKSCQIRGKYFSVEGKLKGMGNPPQIDCDHIIEQSEFMNWYDFNHVLYQSLADYEKPLFCQSFSTAFRNVKDEVNGLENMIYIDTRIHQSKNAITGLYRGRHINPTTDLHTKGLQLYFDGPVFEAKEHFMDILPVIASQMHEDLRKMDPLLSEKVTNAMITDKFLNLLNVRHEIIVRYLQMYTENLKSEYHNHRFVPSQTLHNEWATELANIKDQPRRFDVEAALERYHQIHYNNPSSVTSLRFKKSEPILIDDKIPWKSLFESLFSRFHE